MRGATATATDSRECRIRDWRIDLEFGSLSNQSQLPFRLQLRFTSGAREAQCPRTSSCPFVPFMLFMFPAFRKASPQAESRQGTPDTGPIHGPATGLRSSLNTEDRCLQRPRAP